MRYEGPTFYDDDGVFDTYAKLRADVDSANDTLERPLMRALLGEVRGEDIVDLGCGTADFGRELVAAGAASYLGVDGSRNMVEQAALVLQGTAGRVIRVDLQDWQPPAASCSRVCARLVLHYLPSLEAVFRQVHRALRPGGLFVFSVEHPVITSFDHRGDDGGPREGWLVDHYFETGRRVTEWMGAEVVKYHRTVEDHFLALQAAGFGVESVRESRPLRANFRSEDNFLRRQRTPLFLFMAGRK
jgi:SAM-dependent methyltransferase